MNLENVVTVKPVLQTLSEKRLTSYNKAREIASLQKAVNAEYDFYVQEERKIIEVYAEKDGNGFPVFVDNSRVRLKDAEATKAYEEEIKALRATEIDPIAPVTLCEADFRTPDDFPTAAEMIALESFVIFE